MHINGQLGIDGTGGAAEGAPCRAAMPASMTGRTNDRCRSRFAFRVYSAIILPAWVVKPAELGIRTHTFPRTAVSGVGCVCFVVDASSAADALCLIGVNRVPKDKHGGIGPQAG